MAALNILIPQTHRARGAGTRGMLPHDGARHAARMRTTRAFLLYFT